MLTEGPGQTNSTVLDMCDCGDECQAEEMICFHWNFGQTGAIERDLKPKQHTNKRGF